ncbi:hypothetical protein [Nonomuraea sp. NPDC050643]|uniref:hypothetical protein n=1 Tax=Nonomuraea sp. NPDC050643 TaxID=3155660 RepID=UPI0034061605
MKHRSVRPRTTARRTAVVFAMAGVLSIGVMAAPASADSGSPAHNLWHWICGCQHSVASISLEDVVRTEWEATP